MSKIITQKQFDTFDFNDKLNRILRGTMYYPSVHRPNYAPKKKFNSAPVYSVVLALEGEELDKAKEWGLRILEPNDSVPQEHVRIVRKIQPTKPEEETLDEKTLEKVKKPEVVDPAQRPISEEILIGNGSKGTVKFSTYSHPTMEKNGVGTALTKVQVLELVEYHPPKRVDNELEMDEDFEGFGKSTAKVEDHEGELLDDSDIFDE